jgi:L-amino acid N-acyltransferase YncA
LLYAAFEDDCRRERVVELKAVTNLGNEASIRFHDALGWTRADVEDYAGPGRMRIVFTRPLSR